jgi:RNA polymerase sigma-70 factor (ECF subfamily)
VRPGEGPDLAAWLESVKLGGPGAWAQFYERYCDLILRYARRRGLNEHDAEDVVQETMLTLARLLPAFEYDPRRGRFVNFVLTVAHRKILALLRRASRRHEVGWVADEAGGVAGAWVAPEEGGERWREVLAAEAVRRVRECPRTNGRTFAVFDAYVLQCRTVTCVTREFGMKPNAVYQIRNRFLKRVREEVRELEIREGVRPESGAGAVRTERRGKVKGGR